MSSRHRLKLLLWSASGLYLLTLLVARTTPRAHAPRDWSQFADYDPHRPPTHTLGDAADDDSNDNFFAVGAHVCSRHGTLNASAGDGCACRRRWYGLDCGLPDMVYFPLSELGATVRRRHTPRRIIHAFNVNHEYDLVEAKMHELADVVDAFVVCESNYTARGDAKPLRFLHRLAEGFLAPFHRKIVYVFLDHFPPNGSRYGWLADDYLRTFLGRRGLAQIGDARADDVFLLSDADEIPRWEVLLFMKLYDGWPEPVALNLRWSYYGFFWKHRAPWRIVSVTTLGTLAMRYGNDAICVRRREQCEKRRRRCAGARCGAAKTMLTRLRLGSRPAEQQNSSRFADNEKQTVSSKANGPPSDKHEWTIGDTKHPAGWHCSWCFPPEGIIVKMVSAQNGDYPRWGDYPELLNVTEIRKMIASGSYFDGNSCHMVLVDDASQDRYFAPRYLLENKHRFGYLLDHSRAGEPASPPPLAALEAANVYADDDIDRSSSDGFALKACSSLLILLLIPSIYR